MSLAVVLSRGLSGLDAPLVRVEVHVGGGLPGIHIVGLPETEVKEARHRVRAALATSHFEIPAGKITVNLAPADLPKESGRFDLPIAVGILAATKQVPAKSLGCVELAGELAFSGGVAADSGRARNDLRRSSGRPRIRRSRKSRPLGSARAMASAARARDRGGLAFDLMCDPLNPDMAKGQMARDQKAV